MLKGIVVATLLGAALLGATCGASEADAQGVKRHTPAPPPAETKAGAHRVEIINHEAATIVSIYISPERDDDWGDDLLGDDELDARSAATVSFRGPCRADVRIDFDGGASESRRDVDVCRFPSLVIEPGWTLKPMVAA